MAQKKLKDAVLDAAFDLVEENGPRRLTLDAVAMKAGVSKGGLLHHYRSKEALLIAMMERVVRSFDEDLVAMLGATADTSPDLISGYLRHGFSGSGAHFRHSIIVLAMLAHQPELLEPVRAYFRARAKSMKKLTANPVPVLAAMLMADALWMFDSLGISPVSIKQRKEVLAAVLAWVNQNQARKAR